MIVHETFRVSLQKNWRHNWLDEWKRDCLEKMKGWARRGRAFNRTKGIAMICEKKTEAKSTCSIGLVTWAIQTRQAEQQTWFSLRSRFNTSISWVWSWTIACSLQHQGPVHNVSIRTLLLFCQKTIEAFLDDVHTQATSESPANSYRKQAEGYLAWKPSRFWL
jgi:hypothetical protein